MSISLNMFTDLLFTKSRLKQLSSEVKFIKFQQSVKLISDEITVKILNHPKVSLTCDGEFVDGPMWQSTDMIEASLKIIRWRFPDFNIWWEHLSDNSTKIYFESN